MNANYAISGALSQAEVHKYDKEDICIHSGDRMLPNEGRKKADFAIEICCPKKKNSDENVLVLDIKEAMESLILSRLNQNIESKGE